jgi:hypothetical protein
LRISDVGGEVLLNGINRSACGNYSNFANKESDPYEVYFAPLQLLRTTKLEDASNYALQYYSATGAKHLECASAVKRQLPLLAQQNATCPFDRTICTQDKNVLLNTGYLDSHADFGINARSGSISLQKSAPLRFPSHRGPHIHDGEVRHELRILPLPP